MSTAPEEHEVGGSPSAQGYADDMAGEEADGEYEDPPSSSKAKGKAPVSSTVKSASKPKGVTKKTRTQPRKEKTSAQLKLIEAAITPAQASRDAEGSGTHVEDYVSPVQAGGQGVKRMLDEGSNEEDEGPSTKKAKVGGAASVDGGRKKAPLKKNRMKGPME